MNGLREAKQSEICTKGPPLPSPPDPTSGGQRAHTPKGRTGIPKYSRIHHSSWTKSRAQFPDGSSGKIFQVK